MASSKGNKGVFTDQLGDLDDLIPPPIPAPVPLADQRDDESPTRHESQLVEGADDDEQSAQSLSVVPQAANGDRPATAPQPRPRRRRNVGSAPTAEVAPEVCKALRRFTSREKARDPMTARTFAQVVLDAIDASQQELAKVWTEPSRTDTGGGGLFTRRPATPPRRRRHSEPPGRIPLTGLHPDDAATIDSLVDAWQAPSRSALVEQALRLYAPLWPATRRGKRGDASTSMADDDEDTDADVAS